MMADVIHEFADDGTAYVVLLLTLSTTTPHLVVNDGYNNRCALLGDSQHTKGQLKHRHDKAHGMNQ